MWLEFQEAVVYVAGDGILIVAALAMAAGLLLATVHLAMSMLRRPG